MIFRRAKLNDGRVVEYRQFPLYRAFRVVNRWFWLPRWIVRRVQRFAIQRRIESGPWSFVRVG